MVDKKKPQTDSAKKIAKEEADTQAAAKEKQAILDEAIRIQKEMNQNPMMTIIETRDPAGNLLQKEIQIGPRPASSVQISMDSKGNLKPDVKIYHENPEAAQEKAVQIMTEILDQLNNLNQN